eukprot:Colp12_sorted_trinity150504_noHs@15964
MRQIFITKFGGKDVLKVIESPDPQPSANEVRIRVKAAGINFADILARQGIYPDAPKMSGQGIVVGYEVAGIIDSVGADVVGHKEGDEVISFTRFGGYSDVVCCKPEFVFKKPAKLSFSEAASIPVTYLTAYQMVVLQGGLKPKERILIQNAGGGVGLAAIDISLHIGAEILGTASAKKTQFFERTGPSPCHRLSHRRLGGRGHEYHRQKGC